MRDWTAEGGCPYVSKLKTGQPRASLREQTKDWTAEGGCPYASKLRLDT